MDDIKIFVKNEKELETLIQTIRIYSQDIRIEFGIEKCATLIIKSGGKKRNNGRNRTTQIKKESERLKPWKGKWQSLGNLGSGHYQTSGDERKK